MGFGISEPQNFDEHIDAELKQIASEMEKERNSFKYKKTIKNDEYPPFLDGEVTYEDGIWEFKALNIEFDEDERIITKFDVEIESDGGSVTQDLTILLTTKYLVKRKGDKELFSKYINTTNLKDNKLLREMKRYIFQNKNQMTVEDKIYYWVEVRRVDAKTNELVQEVKTLLVNAGLKWTGKRHVMPLTNNICKPVNNTDLLNFIVDLTEIKELIQVTLDKALTYFTREKEPVKHCIVTENGYYDFNIQQFFTESEKEIIIDKKTPYRYREDLIDVEPPETLKTFLTDIFKKKDDNVYKDLKKDVTSLLELVGYMLDDGNKFQILITFIGESNSGKGLTMRLVNFLLDGKVCDVDIFKGRSSGKELNALVENDLNVIHEFKSGSKNDINFFKQVTGGDNLQISKLYREPKTYTHNEYAKTVLTANDVNDLIEDTDKATIRRLSTFIIFKNVPNKTIDDLDEQIRDEPDAMDWLLTNSIESYAKVLRTGNDFKAKHNNDQTVEMLKKFNKPILKELQEAYYYDYASWEFTSEFAKENGVRPKDIKTQFAEQYPSLNSNKKFAEIIREAFNLNNKNEYVEEGRYITKQYTINKETETYIVGLFKRYND